MNSSIWKFHTFIVLVLCLIPLTMSPAAAPSWTQLAPSGALPAQRAFHSAVYDTPSNRMIVFGGDATCVPKNDTWVLSKANGVGGIPTWTELVTTGTTPAARTAHSAVYDAATNRMIIFGGIAATGCSYSNALMNDVWVLSNANGMGAEIPAWTQLAPAGTAPSGRTNHSTVYDASSNRMIVFGGNPNEGSCSGAVNDVWVLSNANGLGGVPTWKKLAPTGGLPSVRRGHTAAYEPSSNRMIVFGGDNPCGATLNDVWVLTNANDLGTTPPSWTQLAPSGALPPARTFHSAVYDRLTNRMTIFGGGSLNDAWVLQNANRTGGSTSWTQLAPGGPLPPGRGVHTAILDAITRRMTIFGGFTSAGRSNDTWVLADALGDVPTECLPPPSGLLSWWTADGDTSELTGRNLPATLYGNATFGSGMVGQAFMLDGDRDWVDLGNGAGDFGTEDFTLGLWVRFDDLTGEQILIEKYVEDFSGGRGWTLTKIENKVYLYALAGDIQTQPITALDWHHIAVTRAGTTFTMYLNGVAQDTETLDPNLSSTATLKIGHRGAPEDTPGSLDTRGFYLRGAADEVEIYSRALSASEIEAIFAAGSAGKCKNLNQPPVADNKSVTTAEDASASFNLTGSDPEGNSLTFTVLSNPSNGTLTGTGASRTYEPTPDFNGSDSFTFKVNDGIVDSAPATVSITVTQVNDPPTFDAIANQSTVEDALSQTVIISGVSPGPVNEASQSVTFSATSSDTTIVPNPVISGTGASSTLSYQPAANKNGEVTITVTASDNGVPNLNSTRTFAITITPVNDPPQANAGGPYMVAEGGSITLDGSGSDLEGDLLTFTWDLDDNGTFEASGQSAAFATARRDAPGSQTVALRVCDGALCATTTTIVTITNAAPTATFSAGAISEGNSSTLSLSDASDASSADTAAGFRYSFACDGQDSSLALSYGAAGTANSATCVFSDNGSHTVKGRIFDKESGFSTYQATVVVTNVIPTVGAISAPASPVQINTAVTTSASFTDPGTLDTHTAIWNWGDGTTSSGVVTETNGSGSVSGTHTYTAAGVYTVTLTVTDKDTGSGQASFSSLVVYNKILFTSMRDGNFEVYSMDIDGSAPVRLTNNAASDAFPAWSPDSAKIAFTSNRDGGGANEIYKMNANGSGQTRLTTGARAAARPDWSPDGMKIAFTSNRDGNNEIYTINADGTGLTRLTNNSSLDAYPAWSPDGKKVSFISNRNGNNEIYVMNADGTAQTRVTTNARAIGTASWSPDGTKIAFASTRDGNLEIYTMNADGSSLTRLTTNLSLDAEPAWSIDSAKIVFTSNRDGAFNSEIYSMNANGSSLVRLTTNSALETSPHW